MRVIIIGAGKVGYKLAEKLSQENHEVLIIEQNEDRRKILQENLDVLVSGGNGASPRVLADAGVTHSDLLVAVTDQDEVNMLACMVAKRAGVGRTVARVRSPEYVQKDQALFREWMGIDLLINPEMVTALEILQILKTPAALDVEEFAGGLVRLLEVRLRADSPFANIPLKSLTLPDTILVSSAIVSRTNSSSHSSPLIVLLSLQAVSWVVSKIIRPGRLPVIPMITENPCEANAVSCTAGWLAAASSPAISWRFCNIEAEKCSR